MSPIENMAKNPNGPAGVETSFCINPIAAGFESILTVHILNRHIHFDENVIIFSFYDKSSRFLLKDLKANFKLLHHNTGLEYK